MPPVRFDQSHRNEARRDRLPLGSECLALRPSESAKQNAFLYDSYRTEHQDLAILPKYDKENSYNKSKIIAETIAAAIPPVGSFDPPRVKPLLALRLKEAEPPVGDFSPPRVKRGLALLPKGNEIKHSSQVILIQQLEVSTDRRHSTKPSSTALAPLATSNGSFASTAEPADKSEASIDLEDESDNDSDTESLDQSGTSATDVPDAAIVKKMLEKDPECGIAIQGVGSRSIASQSPPGTTVIEEEYPYWFSKPEEDSDSSDEEL
ncbi:hypothetical protein OHC33_000853 [Knufia fluminis]|uniref:Uncharacterized protein n=1 Tax=Knufia fluminis TaxID=191047 RepID=A0AAN8IBU6_9EURO|nr:hypothetical protein OHC33_000853 [Knufia fluminis]